jgi:hypothetical protein
LDDPLVCRQAIGPRWEAGNTGDFHEAAVGLNAVGAQGALGAVEDVEEEFDSGWCAGTAGRF